MRDDADSPDGGDPDGAVRRAGEGRSQRDLALAEAQEAVHIARFDHRAETPEGRTPVGGPDSFYNGVRHAESIIRDLRGGDVSGLAVEHANLLQGLRKAVADDSVEWVDANIIRLLLDRDGPR